MTVRVLVTDGTERAALAAVRSLGRAGHRPFVAVSRLPALAAASRYSRGVDLVPRPDLEPERFVEALARVCRERSIDVLIPSTDAAMSAVLPRTDLVLPTRVPAPPASAFEVVANRDRLLETARSLGIPVPEQEALRHPEDVGRIGQRFSGWQVAVKPSAAVMRVTSDGNGADWRRVGYAATSLELPSLARSFPAEAYPLLVQRRVEGEGLGVFLLVWDGRVYAAFAHRRIRERPPSGGASVFRESRPLAPELLEWSRALLEKLDWRGVAMVEFKQDVRRGRPVLMEVNGRFWGSLQLAIDAGVDFPRLLVELAMGRRVTPVLSYRVGVRSRWWWGEVDHVIALLKGSYDPAGASPGVRLCRAAAAMRGWLTPARSEVLRLHDPRPFLVETGQWLRSLDRRRHPSAPS